MKAQWAQLWAIHYVTHVGVLDSLSTLVAFFVDLWHIVYKGYLCQQAS